MCIRRRGGKRDLSCGRRDGGWPDFKVRPDMGLRCPYRACGDSLYHRLFSACSAATCLQPRPPRCDCQRTFACCPLTPTVTQEHTVYLRSTFTTAPPVEMGTKPYYRTPIGHHPCSIAARLTSVEAASRPQEKRDSAATTAMACENERPGRRRRRVLLARRGPFGSIRRTHRRGRALCYSTSSNGMGCVRYWHTISAGRAGRIRGEGGTLGASAGARQKVSTPLSIYAPSARRARSVSISARHSRVGTPANFCLCPSSRLFLRVVSSCRTVLPSTHIEPCLENEDEPNADTAAAATASAHLLPIPASRGAFQTCLSRARRRSSLLRPSTLCSSPASSL